MSRRHNSSRRRNYGRRQHEIRERRPSSSERGDWPGPGPASDWHVGELDDERSTRAGEGFGATNP